MVRGPGAYLTDPLFSPGELKRYGSSGILAGAAQGKLERLVSILGGLACLLVSEPSLRDRSPVTTSFDVAIAS